MKAHPPGTVFSSPSLWASEWERGRKEAKNRTTCMLLAIAVETGGRASYERLVLFGITDTVRDDQAALEIPSAEKRRAGLTVHRPAFVVISEANEDVHPGSWHYAPGEPVFGRFSSRFTDVIATAARAIMKAGGLQRVRRS
jgi:hypothetical protein